LCWAAKLTPYTFCFTTVHARSNIKLYTTDEKALKSARCA